MEKILKLIILLALCINFSYAQTKYDKQFRQFDGVYKTLSKNQMKKYHRDLKSIYIKSIIDDDLILKIKSLQRLIIASSKLGLDFKAYKQELVTLKKMAGKKGFKLKKLNLPNLDTRVVKTIKVQKRSSNQLPRLIKIIHSKYGVSLLFNAKLYDEDIRKFILKSKKRKGYYRYVYDINGILTSRSKTYKTTEAVIRISQFDKKTLRVVFSSKKRLKLHYSKDEKSVSIGLKPVGHMVAASSYNHQSNTTQSKNTHYSPNTKVIVVDAGHGGKDGGAQGARRLSEKKVVLQVALKLGKELKARGFKVYYTRIRDKYIQLRDRTSMANRKKADLFISIHANAAPNKKKYKDMYGAETFFLSPARSKRSKNAAAQENKSDIAEMDFFSQQTFLNFLNREKILASNKLAIDIQQGMLNSVRKKYKVQDGGVREAPFWVLVGAQMPAVLVEIGYITNPIEGKKIGSSYYQSLLANGIANGIQSYFIKNN